MEKTPSPISTKEMPLKRKASIEVPIVNSKSDDETKAEKTEILDGEPNKEIIKLSDLMTNMDPLEYFSRFLGIPELIFQHLSGKDLFAASEVSPSYYNFTASSKVLMQKIKVVFDRDLKCELIRIPESNHRRFKPSSKNVMHTKFSFHDKCDSEDYNLLKSSSRLYQNIEIKRSDAFISEGNGKERPFGDYVTNSELDFFHGKAHEWKNVSLDNVYLRKRLDLYKLLSAIESSVESISVADFGFLSFNDPYSEIESFEALKFPKLKKLKMTFTENCIGGYTWARFFLNSVTIEALDLGDRSQQVDKYTCILKKMLQNFDKLTTLHIDLLNFNQIFEDESWKQFKFKLKSLKIVAILYNESKPNFRNFLKSQSDYLEKLIFPADKEIFDVIMKMPKLKSFTLINFRAFLENKVPIKISNSITELTLLNYDNRLSLKFEMNFKFVLNAMPKVTNLTIKLIDEKHFRILKSMKRKFEKLKVIELKGVNRKEIEEIMTENYTSLEIVKSI